MGVEVVYWLLAVIAVGVIVVMAIGIRGAGKDSDNHADAGWTPPPAEAPVTKSTPSGPSFGGAEVKPVRPVVSDPRRETGKSAPVHAGNAAPVQTGPKQITIYQFPLESVTCVCPKCDGENNPAHKFCWICGQRIS